MSRDDAKGQPPAWLQDAVRTSEQPVETQDLSPEQEIEQLRRQLREKEDEAHAAADRFLRERAELENFKKRMQRDKAEAMRFASEPLIRDLLPVVDNLERAIAHEDADGRSIRDGVRIVLDSLLGILAAHGVQPIDAVGERFDPAKHQALAQRESAEEEPNRVLEQHQRGYRLHDRLLRPALVTVSARQSDTAGGANGSVEKGETNG